MSDTVTNIIGKDVKLFDNGDGTFSIGMDTKAEGGKRLADLFAGSVGEVGSVDMVGAGIYTAPTGYYFFCIDPETDIVVSERVDIADSINADLTQYTAISKAKYGRWSSITLTSGEATGYLTKV